MSTFYYATEINGDHLFDNFPVNLKYLIAEYQESSKPIEITYNNNPTLARIGRKVNNFGILYALTTNDKFVSRFKLFKEVIDSGMLALPSLTLIKKDILREQTAKTEALIHNITSLNGYSIQDLYSLIPQDTLSKNINKQHEVIKQIIIDNTEETVATLMKLIKHSLAMKVEFSVFERTQKNPNYVQKMSHSIRNIILSILPVFIEDFEKKKIEVSLDATEISERRLEVDYDSLFVSFFYLLDNSIKYCCNDTKYKIIFTEDGEEFAVLFKMVSIRIFPSEIEKLTVNGFRSDLARKVHKEGSGIGLFRIQKTLKLNNAELIITPKINTYTKKIHDIDYDGNEFKVLFKSQKKWL